MKTGQTSHYCNLYSQCLKAGEALSPEQFLDREGIETNVQLLSELRSIERDGAMHTPARADAAQEDQPAECAPTQLGTLGEPLASTCPYKLLQVIGEGGMGVVYMAEQTEPVSRRVALKIIKPGMSSKEVLARFEAERQALALMDHPNIARVFDAGATELGHPYFAMELVKGVPITQYCDQKQLSPRERLELFLPVCQAVQHAHQKGIIHRDLKPSNILVAQYDDQPVPKIIDFGLAKAISLRLTDKTMFTQFGQIVGTIDYMSPEQATFNQLDVDTRSDIYSLGVLLYELLTGETPFDRQRLHAAAFDEILRIIQQEEPPKPSLRLSSNAALPTIAASRRTEPRKLTLLVRGDLDWITMKALEKDRSRRYETANGLARDIQRYLYDEPVEACPPSAVYRLRKLASRHRRLLATGSALTLSLVFGLIGTIWQASQARRQAEIAQAVQGFLTHDLLEQATPHRHADPNVKLRTVLDRAAEKVEGRFPDEPLVEAAIRGTIGDTYLQLGAYQAAAPHLHRASELFQAKLGDHHPDTLRTMHQLGLLSQNQGQFEDARALFEQTLDLQKQVLGEEHEDTLESMNSLAMLYADLERPDLGLPLAERTLEIQRRVLGEEHESTLATMSNLVLLYGGARRDQEAQALCEGTLRAQQRVLGEEHPATLATMTNLAFLLGAQGHSDEALVVAEETREIAEGVLSDEHPMTLMAMYNLAVLYADLGHRDQAKALSEQTLEIQRRVLGGDHPSTLRTMHNLALLYAEEGRTDEAIALLEENLKIARSAGREVQPVTLNTMYSLAEQFRQQGRVAEANSLFGRIQEIVNANRGHTLGADH